MKLVLFSTLVFLSLVCMPTCGYDITEKHFKDISEEAGGNLVVLFFTAPWCSPCQEICKRLPQLTAEHPNVLFEKINVDQDIDIAITYEVTKLPTFVFIKNEKEVNRLEEPNIYKLNKLIKKYK